jgi:hypothetical protein
VADRSGFVTQRVVSAGSHIRAQRESVIGEVSGG